VGRSKTKSVDRSIPGTDFLQLDTAGAPAGGLSGWLAHRLRAAVADGRLPVGGRLPASRVLAEELGVSRGVVTEAYRRLAEDGLVTGQGRRGTIVAAAPVAVPPGGGVAPPGGALPGGAVLPAPAGNEVFDLLRQVPARIDLSPGVPDLAVFPRAAWLRAERSVLAGLSAADFGYGDPRGAPAFRVAVANWLARNRGISVTGDDVIVVAGVAQALALLALVLRDHGISEIAVEDPGSLGTRQLLRAWRMLTPPVRVDSGGLRVSELAASGAPAVLLTPAHQFPTGVVLAGDRRRALLRWAAGGGLIVEDDYDAEHRYDRPPVPALRSVLAEQVCYTGTVSKLLAPALRAGWMIVPHRYRDAVTAAKRDSDLGNAVLPQLVLGRLMESGDLERHLRLLRRRHRRRRDVMISAIRTHLPSARVHGTAAGLHLMITFDGTFADTALAGASLARGVKVHPLSWHSQRPRGPGLILGYAASSPGAISDGIATIGEALRRLS
jgi:GntR family transcriptional regulator/MocR family aminotransferase